MNQQGTWAAFARAEQLIEWKRYREALRELEHILRKEPDNPDALALIARVYHLQDEYENALYWARMALKREPDHQLAWFVRVCVFYETDKEKEFDEAVHNAMRIDPYEPHYYFLLKNPGSWSAWRSRTASNRRTR